MATAIYNCKHCKTTGQVAAESSDAGTGGRVYPGVRWGAAQIGDKPRLQGDGVCTCGRQMSWGFLQAWTNPATKCDLRCEHARGFKCDCSCGGENHGAGWGGMFTGLLAA